MIARPVVFLNGPPRCGKDTLAKHIVQTLPGFKYDKPGRIMKERVHALYGRPDLPHDAFEDCKDEPNDLFFGHTPRQTYINVSEKLMKQSHGEDVYGQLLLKDLLTAPETVRAFVIDGGFTPEVRPLIRHYGPENCILIRIHAEKRGKTFKNDSRSYLKLPIETFDVYNNGFEQDFLNQSMKLLGSIFQSMVGGA